MIVKPRNVPIQIKQMDALLRRLPKDHPKREFISNNLSKRIAGYKGEKELDYPLSFLPDSEYRIFHDLRLFDGSHYFQLDSLIVSKQYILILEVKNMLGILRFDPDFNQLIRIYDGKEEAFSDPFLQLERQSDQLKNWLIKHDFPKVPIKSLVVIATPQTIIQTTSNNPQILDRVLHCAKLPFKIKSFQNDRHKVSLSSEKLRNLTDHLIKHHIPLEATNLFKQNSISKDEIIKGVQCDDCLSFLMERKVGKWECPTCEYTSKTAHLKAINDYALLFGNGITNPQLRDFLGISSSSVAKKLLSSLNLKWVGRTKGRVYYLEV